MVRSFGGRTPEYVDGSHLQRFMPQHGIGSWHELYEHSVEDVAWFTEAMLTYLDIQFYEPYQQVVDLSAGVPWARWCVGGQMNIVHNCLDKWMGTPQRNVAALRLRARMAGARAHLRGAVSRSNRVADGLRSLGLGKGDAIALFMPMTPEIAIALLAIAKIGGIILPLFSGYGAGAVASRLVDADAKALFTADGVFRRGRPVPMKTIADEALLQAPGVRHVIVYRRTGEAVPWTAGRDLWGDELVSLGQSERAQAETERTDAEDLLMMIYTSGTTGKPKGAVHTHCGFPIKAARTWPSARRAPRGDPLLDDRYGLDDGALAGVRHAAAGRDDALLRWRARLSRPRPAVGAGGAPRRDRAGRLANPDPRADA